MVLALTEELVQKRLAEVIQPKFRSDEFRLSETGRCQRMRVLRVLGYEPEPTSEEEARYFERGNIAEAWVVNQYRRAYPRRTRTQALVKTRWGDTGHIDLWFPAERRIIEVKSVGRAGFDGYIPKDEHLAQVQAYLHFFRDSQGAHKADEAELVYVDMDTLRTRVFPVRRDPAQGERIEQQLAELHRMAEAGELPKVEYFPDEPPCMTNTPSGPKRCAFWKQCHSEDGLDLEFGFGTTSLEALEDLAWEHEEVSAKLKEAKAVVDELEARLKEIRAAMGEAMDAAGADEAQAGAWTIRRTFVAGRMNYDIDSAHKAGILTDEIMSGLMAYAKQGSGYYRWTVKPAKKEGK